MYSISGAPHEDYFMIKLFFTLLKILTKKMSGIFFFILKNRLKNFINFSTKKKKELQTFLCFQFFLVILCFQS